MKKKFYLFLVLSILFANYSFTQLITFEKQDTVFMLDSARLQANYCIPLEIQKPPVVLIIAGSGPTDKDGNNFFMKNNHLKFLAEQLAMKGIASLRYDKRTIASNKNNISEEKLRFGDLVNDAVYLTDELKKDTRFENTILLGHSQGALIAAMVAQKTKVKILFLVAGPGIPIHETILAQVSSQSAKLGNEAKIVIDSLMEGHIVKKIHPLLMNTFRPSVQPFLSSWMKLDPAAELKKVKARVIIIQGDSDLQVTVEDASRLKDAAKNSRLFIIHGMNHILKNSPANREENIKTYSNPELPVKRELIEIIWQNTNRKS